MLIKVKGKQYMLKFTYKSIYYLEIAFDKPFEETIKEQTPFNQQLMTFWAMMINEEEFKNLDILGMADVVQESLDNGDFTLDELFEKVNKAYLSSTMIKQIFNISDTDSPSDSGEHERVSEPDDGRSRIHGFMSRVRNSCRAFLEEFSKRI